MSHSSFVAAVNYHTWEMARLKVPVSQLEHRPENTALAAATNIITALNLDISKQPANNSKTPALYALVGWTARGPHDPSPSPRRVIAVLHAGTWKAANLINIYDFIVEAENNGWLLAETAEIFGRSQPVLLAKEKGFLPVTESDNYFQMMLFVRSK